MMQLMFLISGGLSMVLILLNSSVGEKSMSSREASSAFECGFDPKSMARLPFSLHFFLIALVFLIFDVEITLLIPAPIILNESNIMMTSTVYSFFLMILIAGVLIEWVGGALNWNF